MRRISLLAMILLAGAVKAFAASPEAPRADRCPCDRPGFSALTDKARVAADFWKARRHKSSANTVSTVILLGSLLGGNLNNPTLGEAADANGKADADYARARERAVAAGAVRFEMNGDEESVFVLLEQGKDFVIVPGK